MGHEADAALISRHAPNLVMILDGLVEAQEDRASRDKQDAARIIVVQVPHPERDREHLEDVERVQDLGDEDLEDRLLGHVDFALSELHSLELSQCFVADTTWIRVHVAELVVGILAVKSNGNELVQCGLPFKVYEAVCEERGQTLDTWISVLRFLDELIAPLAVVQNVHYLLVLVTPSDVDMRRRSNVSCSLVEPIPLHWLAPVEEYGPDEEGEEGYKGHDKPLLNMACLQQDSLVHARCLLVLVVGGHPDEW